MKTKKIISDKQKEYGLFIVCSLILAVFYLRNISKLTNPAIMLDEIGYWASAAYFKGYNWSGVIGNFAAYYSFGYSFLLYLFMNLANTPEIIHQIAILANVLMVCMSFFLTVKIIKVMCPTASFYVRCVASFASFFYPSIQYHTQVAWTENYLMFMFICSIYVAIKLYEDPKIINHIFFVAILFNMYIIHMRSLGIVIVGVIYVLWIYIIHKKHIGKWIISLLILLALLYGASKVKNLLYQNVFVDTLSAPKWEVETSSATNANDFGGQIWKIKYLFSLEGIYNFFISILGKFWYFGLASFFLGFDGFVVLISQIKDKVKARQFRSLEISVCLYIIVAYIATALIAAIAMITPGRWDTVAYGRYTDCLGIVILASGIIYLCQASDSQKRKGLFCYVIASLVFLIIFCEYAEKNSISGFFASCSQIMLYFKNLNEEKFIILMALSTVAIAMVIGTMGCVIKHMKIYWISGLGIVMWLVFTNPSIKELLELERHDWIYPVIEYIEENQCENIYYLYSDESTYSENFYTGGIQYMLMDRSLYCIKDVNEIELENPCIITGWSIQIPENYSITSDFGFYRIISEN